MTSPEISGTPVIEGSKYRVHDSRRPQPRVVTPGEGTAPPSDAAVLFDGSSLDEWESVKGSAAGWKIVNGCMEVEPGCGNIRTRKKFGRIQLHLEFSEPESADGEGQGRGNSGVFLMEEYEIQVLDNYENPTYADGIVGAIYGQCPPLVNAIRPPGEWNSFDIFWEPPLYAGSEVERPACVTVLLNGVVLHHHRKLLGATSHKKLPKYEPHPPEGRLMLQDHGDPVRFRNIWARPMGEYDS